ncbi:hypothetical protein T4B_12202 [Trichinella pseudospiralis]|uniref:Uncharacterized protein n=1 Tax=Trichinella pseudospiralis TaxID=6337 RepID=A0A0V1IJH1_TRIPS|nr:hypothetical protein T4B_12202 [Trichinella pseudospiralis]
MQRVKLRPPLAEALCRNRRLRSNTTHPCSNRRRTARHCWHTGGRNVRKTTPSPPRPPYCTSRLGPPRPARLCTTRLKGSPDRRLFSSRGFHLALSSPGLALPFRSQSDCVVDETALISSLATSQRLRAGGDDSSSCSRFDDEQARVRNTVLIIRIVVFVLVFCFCFFSNSNCIAECLSNVVIVVVLASSISSSFSFLSPHLNCTTLSPSSDISLGSCALANTISPLAESCCSLLCNTSLLYNDAFAVTTETAVNISISDCESLECRSKIQRELNCLIDDSRKDLHALKNNSHVEEEKEKADRDNKAFSCHKFSMNKAKIKRKRGRHEANLGGHLEEKEVRRNTLRGVLTKSIFCFGVFCKIYSLGELNSAFSVFILYCGIAFHISTCITIIQNGAYLYVCDEVRTVKLMKKKKVKTRTTRSQCQSAHRRTRDEKRQAEACFD